MLRLWVVDVNGRRIHDCSQPEQDGGRYLEEAVVEQGSCSVEIAGVRVEVQLGELFRI